MNSYEERKQARIDRYNEKAAESAKRSNALIKQSSDMLSVIPFGQPILVGHHSETRDRNYRARAGNKMAQGVRESDKADYYAAKAQATASNRTISSDDPEAITKLEAQFVELTAFQEEMKKANAHFRKHKTMQGFPGLDNDKAATFDAKIKARPSYQQEQPYASYKLTNNNANIRRIKSRIEELKKRDELFPATDGDESNDSGWSFDGGSVVMNTELNRIQILFDEKPDEEIRAQLKSRGFKWAPSQGAWQRQLNANGLYAVKQIACIQPSEGG